MNEEGNEPSEKVELSEKVEAREALDGRTADIRAAYFQVMSRPDPSAGRSLRDSWSSEALSDRC